MDYYFIFVQLLGFLAWIVLVLSYYRKNTNKILIYHILANILYCIHYWMLNAYSGFFICLIEIIFDYGYYKTDKDKYIYITSIPIRILCGLINYKSLIDILPIIASLVDGYTLTKKKKTVIIGAIISYSLWVIYDLFVLSYTGAITNTILVLSNLFILIFNYNIFKFNIYNDGGN